MLKKLKTLVIAICLLAGFGLAVPVAMAVDCTQSNLTTQQAIQCGTNGTNGSTNVSDQQTTAATDSFNNIITTILNILSVVVGIVAVAMIILAGFKFVTSGGNQEGVKSAKNSLMYAIIGLIIVALAQIIVQFVLNKTVNNAASKTPNSSTQNSSPSSTPNSSTQNSSPSSTPNSSTQNSSAPGTPQSDTQHQAPLGVQKAR